MVSPTWHVVHPAPEARPPILCTMRIVLCNQMRTHGSYVAVHSICLRDLSVTKLVLLTGLLPPSEHNGAHWSGCAPHASKCIYSSRDEILFDACPSPECSACWCAADSPNAFHYKQRSGQPVSPSAGLPLIHRKYLSLSHSTWSGNLVLSEL